MVTAAVAPARGSRRRYDLLSRLGIEPTIAARLRVVLGEALAEAETRSPGSIAVLDAGCGRTSPLLGYRDRIARFVGVDIHPPAAPLAYLDEFATVDLCRDREAFGEGTFDVILSNFTVEHFAEPRAALANLQHWLRPHGTLVITTVNRRHPFVAAYLGMPEGPRRRLQPVIKASAADAHPLVGACNDPASVRATLEAVGFDRVAVETVGNLARAWGRLLPTFAVGMAGDLIAQRSPSRRSTILAVGRKPAPSDTHDA